MYAGKNMGIMTTLKKTYCRKDPPPPTSPLYHGDVRAIAKWEFLCYEQINAFDSRCDHEHPRLPRASVVCMPTVRQSLERNTIYTFGNTYARWEAV